MPTKRELLKANVNPKLADHAEIEIKSERGKVRARVRHKDMIVLYRQRGAISRRQYEAALSFRRDYEMSGLSPWARAPDDAVYTGNQPVPGMGPRYVQYMQAKRALGPVLGSVAHAVVLENESADQWARSSGRREGDGIAALRLALDILAGS